MRRNTGKGPDARNRFTETAAKELHAGLAEGRGRTGPQVRQWLAEAHNIQIAEGTVYGYLGKFAARLKMPRKAHVRQDAAKVAEFKTSMADKLAALNIPAGRPVRLWVLDEARFGLHTEHRREWALRGVRVVKPHQQKYQWQYVIGALEVAEHINGMSLIGQRKATAGLSPTGPRIDDSVILTLAARNAGMKQRGEPARIHVPPSALRQPVVAETDYPAFWSHQCLPFAPRCPCLDSPLRIVDLHPHHLP